jgi:general secretion pathway protein H
VNVFLTGDRKRVSSAGFTFVELMVVIVIIALMTSFAIPEIRTSLYSDQLKATTRKILGLVSEASQEAVSRHAEFSLYFDFEQNTISTIQDENQLETDDHTARGTEINVGDAVRIIDVTSVHGGKETQGRAIVRFTKQGYVDKTLIHLRSENGDEMTIMLSPFLGVTKVYDSYVSMEDEQIQY